MQNYRVSNRVPFQGFLTLVLAAVVGGVVVGALVAVAAHFIYLVVLFPMIMGLVGGAIVVAVVKSGKVRSPWIAGLFGLLIGLIIYGTYRYGEYIDAQRQFYDVIKAKYDQINETDSAGLLDKYLSDETGSTGFMGYVLLDAKQGVKITRTVSTSTESGMTFAGNMAWIYWGIELLAIVGIAGVMAYGQAAQPFCESCETWYGQERWLGSAEKKIAKDLKTALKGGDFARVRAALTPQSLALPRLDLTYQRCEHCTAANPVVRLKQITASGRKNTAKKELLKGEITPAQYTEITGQAL